MSFRILIFSRDPGGANVVIPIVEPLSNSGYEVILYGKDIALSKYSSYGLSGKNIEDEIDSSNIDNVRIIVKKIKPDLIITGTSADDFVEKYLWKIGNEMGIPTIAILDQWMNYGIRFSRYTQAQSEAFNSEKKLEFLPSKIFVMDKTAKNEAIEEGIDADRIIITGQPYFETVLNRWKTIDSEDIIRKRYKIPSDQFVILFVSEPLSKVFNQTNHTKHYYGYTEHSIFSELINALEDISSKLSQIPKVIVRNHPKEDPDSFSKYISKNQKNIIVDNSSDVFELVKMANLVVGMSSMLLIESAILGKNILSVQIGISKKDPFILNRMGITSNITNRIDLGRMLLSYINKENAVNITFPYIKSASVNIVNEVKKNYEKACN